MNMPDKIQFYILAGAAGIIVILGLITLVKVIIEDMGGKMEK